MKAFISISINNDPEGFVFGQKLRKKHFDISGNDNWEKKDLDAFTKRQIQRSNLFIGFITINKDIESVLNEWHFAQSQGILNLLLIEDVIHIPEDLSGNMVIFNRKQPQKAICEIEKLMQMSLSTTTLTREDILTWTLGGEALIDILEWFERNEKREKQQNEAMAA
jgi:hypothetical protein